MRREDFNCLLKEVKNGGEADELIRQCIPLIKKTVNRFHNYGLEYEDLFSIALMGFWESVQMYDFKNPSFLHFLRRVITYKLLNEVRKLNTKKRNPSVTYKKQNTYTIDEHVLNNEFKYEIKKIIDSQLSSYEYTVYNLYYNNLSLEKICSILNKPKKSVWNAIYRSENKIIDKYKEECYGGVKC